MQIPVKPDVFKKYAKIRKDFPFEKPFIVIDEWIYFVHSVSIVRYIKTLEIEKGAYNVKNVKEAKRYVEIELEKQENEDGYIYSVKSFFEAYKDGNLHTQISCEDFSKNSKFVFYTNLSYAYYYLVRDLGFCCNILIFEPFFAMLSNLAKEHFISKIDVFWDGDINHPAYFKGEKVEGLLMGMKKL